MLARPMPGPALPYINDQWTLELDELGFDHEARELARMVLLCEPPFASCVVGRWGSGKTSIMRHAMTLLGGDVPTVRLPYQAEEIEEQNFRGVDRVTGLQERGRDELLSANSFVPFSRLAQGKVHKLEKNSFARVATLWFSPWRFQNEPNPMVPLLHGLREQFTAWAKLKSWGKSRARPLFDAGLEMLAYLADAALTLTGRPRVDAPGVLKAFKHATDKIDSDNLARLTDAERFNLLFEHAIHTLLGVEAAKDADRHPSLAHHRLVIFIDDLDRCVPASSLRLLEAIKLYLSTRYCVFVFGLDLTAVESALATEWSGHPDRLPREYLEKLFQGHIHIPPSGRYAVFIHNRLHEWNLLPAGTARLAAGADMASAHHAARVLADVLPANPRRVKNFLNSVRLAWQIAQTRAPGVLDVSDFERFAVLQRLRAVSPRTFTLLVQDPETNLIELDKFFRVCTAGGDLYEPDPRHSIVRSVLASDFGHIAALDPRWESEPFNPRLALRDVSVRLDTVYADRGLARRWREQEFTAEDFRRCASLAGAAVTHGGPA
jgi:hypothetical protein